jgi:orotate phosphoribosyltransferase
MSGPRAELLDLLRRDGILRAGPAQPILSRDGATAPWMLDSLAVTLTPRGAELAGRCLLDLLARFDGRQLATYGVTGIPLVQSCILQSGGRYRGLLVRKDRKPHGSRKLIEGPIDLAEPVVMIDDSVSSGHSAAECSERLEAAGLRVEGGVALVRFNWDMGFAYLRSRGYRMEAVYDIWRDFIAAMPGEPLPPENPTKTASDPAWDAAAAPEGLHPARLARLAIEALLERGRAPRPPARVAGEWDGRGGVWVSVRSRADVHERYAREGFWHLPGEAAGPLPRDVVLAAAKAANALRARPDARALLERAAVAVTFFGPLEPCAPGALDNDRFGIVVRSRERPWAAGGALPRMPGIPGEWAQLGHARFTNARLFAFEPYEIFRHAVEKAIEPGASWPPSGVPDVRAGGSPCRGEAAGAIAARARELARARLRGGPAEGAPLPADFLAPDLDTLFVTLHARGRRRGCAGSRVRSLEEDLGAIVDAALADERFPGRLGPADADELAATASLLFEPRAIGACPPEEVHRYARFGQALLVWQDARQALLLPALATTHDLSPEAFAREAIDKAGITRPPYSWAAYEVASFLAAGGAAPVRLDGALPEAAPRPVADARRALAPLLADYLLRSERPEGGFFLTYAPFRDERRGEADLARIGHAAWVLARVHAAQGDARLGAAAARAADFLLARTEDAAEGRAWVVDPARRGDASLAEVAFLLLALARLPERPGGRELARRLAATLGASVGVHGRIATHRAPERAAEACQDYVPGEALLALVLAAEAGLAPSFERDAFGRAFRYYRHRFRFQRSWSAVAWLAQAAAAAARILGGREHADFAFEIADWAIEHQQDTTGGFVNEHQAQTPGFTSALYVEGIAAAIALAEAGGEPARAARYRRSCERGVLFLDRLVLQERDRALLPSFDRAAGGVRPSLRASEVRIDFVQHALAALVGISEAEASRAS